MIEEPPLLTIKNNRKRPTAAQIAAFQGVPTGFVVDAMDGHGALSSAVQPLGAGQDIPCAAAGPAITADSGPGDVLATFAALNFLQPGDIVVTAFGGFQERAAIGDRVAGMMKNNGAIGFVTDGPVRDYVGLVDVGLPIWCSGLTPSSPVSTGPGRIGFSIQIGGREIESGDMIVGDRDGVVVVPFENLDVVIARLAEIKVLEQQLDQNVAEGQRYQTGISELLASDKVSYVD